MATGTDCKRRAALLRAASILAWAAAGTGARAAPAGLPVAHDLAADSVAGRSRSVPLLLFFNRSDCPYCERALREFLVPMSTRGDWVDRAVYRQIDTDSDRILVDFSGRRTTHRRFARDEAIRFTPTVAIVGPDGKPLGKPIVGLLTADFYAAFLEEAVQAGIDAVRMQRAGS